MRKPNVTCYHWWFDDFTDDEDCILHECYLEAGHEGACSCQFCIEGWHDQDGIESESILRRRD